MTLTKPLVKPDTSKKWLEDNKLILMQNRYKWHIPTGKVEFSDSWFESLGYKPNELPHHFDTWKSLVHPEDMPEVWKVLESCLDGRADKFRAINRLKMKDGSYRWNLDHGRVTERDRKGNPVFMVGLDIPIAS